MLFTHQQQGQQRERGLTGRSRVMRKHIQSGLPPLVLTHLPDYRCASFPFLCFNTLVEGVDILVSSLQCNEV